MPNYFAITGCVITDLVIRNFDDMVDFVVRRASSEVTELYTKEACQRNVWHYEICTKWYQIERNAVSGKAVPTGVSIYAQLRVVTKQRL